MTMTDRTSPMRLQKFLSQAGICSRRKGEQYIKQGRVHVNGVLQTKIGTKIDPEKDRVTFDGNPVRQVKKRIYIAMNKPKGYITTCRSGDEKTVMDLIDIDERVYPIGRLDKDTTGLLILTNDGRLHQRLSHPSFNHEKEYEVVVNTLVSDGALRKLEKGVPMMGTKTRPAKIKRLSPKRFRITLKEGKNRQIRRMVRKVGAGVSSLKRVRISNIALGRLTVGSWRHLSKQEKSRLLDLAELN